MKLPRIPESFAGLLTPQKGGTVVTHHEDYTVGETTGGLSVLFTVLCIVDLFGVFPVVALPRSVISCGIYGIPLVLSVFSLQLYTAVLLGRSWLLAQQLSPNIREKNRFPYAAVAELAFGVRARQVVTFLLDATIFGAGVPNFIFAAQSMQLFVWKVSGGQVGVSYCVWMILIGLLLCPVMWLGSPKDMKPLAMTSVCIVMTVAACTWACILLDDVSPPSANDVTGYRPTVQDFLVAYGILAFQFDIHPMLLTIQVDMRDGRKIQRAAFMGFAITGCIFAVTAVLAANRYGRSVDANILQGIPPSIPLFVVALLVTVQLCLSSAVGNSALFQHLEDLLKIPRHFCFQRCIIRSSIVALAIFLGETVPRFDLVMGLLGSTLTGPLMFIFPPLFFLKLCYIKSNHVTYKKMLQMAEKDGANGIQNGECNGKNCDRVYPLFRGSFKTYNTFDDQCEDTSLEPDEYRIQWYDVVLAVIVMMMGVTATFVATYSSWSQAITSAKFSPPCLFNVTAAARSFIEDTLSS